MIAMENGHGSARQRVLDVAEHLFNERTYNAVTMKDIARQLGIRQASLYYHVPDGKEQLFVEVAIRTFERHRDGLQSAIEKAGPDLEKQLVAASNWFTSQPPMHLLSMMHADMPALERENTALLSNIAYQCLFWPLAQVFQAAAERGEIRTLSPNLLAGAFLALMDGIAYSAENQPGTPSKEAMARALISMMLDGLRPRDPIQAGHLFHRHVQLSHFPQQMERSIT